MGKRILVVGDVNADIVLTGLAGLPSAEAETLARGVEIVIGGQAGTVARALSRLGMDVVFVGRVGDDDWGRAALRELSAAGVDVSRAVVDPAVPTGATVVLSTGTERAYATFPGALAELRRSDVADGSFAGMDHLHIGSYFLLKALQAELPSLLREARRGGLTTSLDPGWDPSGHWGSGIRDALDFVDVFLPNAAEAVALTGAATPEAALEALASREGTVVVKMGGDGCIARGRGESLRCPSFMVPVVDVTSAGDVFDAGFLHGYLSGAGLAECIRFAAACGAISVSRPGSSGIITGAGQVRDFLNARAGEARPGAITARRRV